MKRINTGFASKITEIFLFYVFVWFLFLSLLLSSPKCFFVYSPLSSSWAFPFCFTLGTSTFWIMTTGGSLLWIMINEYAAVNQSVRSVTIFKWIDSQQGDIETRDDAPCHVIPYATLLNSTDLPSPVMVHILWLILTPPGWIIWSLVNIVIFYLRMAATRQMTTPRSWRIISIFSQNR